MPLGHVFLPFGHEDLLLGLCLLGREGIIKSVGVPEMPAVGSSSVERGSFVSYRHCHSEEPGTESPEV